MKLILRFSQVLQICGLLTVALVMGLGQQINAQANLPIQCGKFDTSSYADLIPSFAGSYYYTKKIGVIDPNHIWEFGVITASGEKTFQAPFKSELARHIVFPRISPDGTKMVFEPLDSDKLVVWKIGTKEIASFTVSKEIADYLADQTSPNVINFNKLVWLDGSTLAIQYFGINYNSPTQQFKLSVQDQPLQISSSTDMTTLSLQAIEHANVVSVPQVSPRGDYTVQVQQSPQTNLRQIQVFKGNTKEFVFQAKSSEDSKIIGDLMWSSDERYLFYIENVPTGTQLAQIDVNQNFTRNLFLSSTLEKQYGTSDSFLSTMLPMISQDGKYMGFGYLERSSNKYYVIRYDPNARKLIAICDETPTTGNVYPFWSPSSRFIASWDNGTVKVYDFDTGNRYLLPGSSFVGWISGN